MTIESRSSSSSCSDLITNGDFENGTQGPDAFGMGSVADWRCATGTADLVGEIWNWQIEEGNQSRWISFDFTGGGNVGYLTCATLGTYGEGIITDVDIHQGYKYFLEFDAATTNWQSNQFDSGDLTLTLEFGSNLDEICNDTPPACESSSTCIEVPITTGNRYPNYLHHCSEFVPTANGDALKIWAKSKNTWSNTSEPNGAFIDNITLRCENPTLVGIDYENISGGSQGQISSCTFDFEGVFDNSGVVSGHIVQHFWFYGDGKVGFGPNPTYTYEEPGMYTVRYRIIDEYGCCAEVETVVMCDLPECSYICHEDVGGPDLTANPIRCVSGFDYFDPATGSSTTVNFTAASYDIYGFPELASVIQYKLVQQGYNVVVTHYDPLQNIECYKAGVGQTEGYFCYGDVRIVNLFGYPASVGDCDDSGGNQLGGIWNKCD